MIKFKHGNILEADTEAIVNTVNCVGIMGRGIALQFKKAFPENFKEYKKVCDQKNFLPGMVFTYNLRAFSNPRYIINFSTKKHWKGKSKLDDIQHGLNALVNEVEKLRVKSISIPPLGCGLGGLKWEVVKPIIVQAFSKMENVEINLYEPKGAPEADKIINRTQEPNMTVGRAALIVLMKKYFEAMLDNSITLLEVQKLMYFMQNAGENLRLNYVKAPYGPYAKNLHHVLNVIEGHFIEGFGEGTEKPDKTITILPHAYKKAEQYLSNSPETNKRLQRVVTLIEGFETPYGMELLSTVLWVANKYKTDQVEKIFEHVSRWSGRKQKIMKPEHIKAAYERLKKYHWINNNF